MILLFFFSFFASNAELEKQKQEVIIKKNLKRGNTIFSLNYIINYMTIYTDQNKAKFFPNVTLDKVENMFLIRMQLSKSILIP